MSREFGHSRVGFRRRADAIVSQTKSAFLRYDLDPSRHPSNAQVGVKDQARDQRAAQPSHHRSSAAVPRRRCTNVALAAAPSAGADDHPAGASDEARASVPHFSTRCRTLVQAHISTCQQVVPSMQVARLTPCEFVECVMPSYIMQVFPKSLISDLVN